MTTVSRDSFVSRLSAGINVDNMGQGLAQALGQAGIDPARLRAIAGADGKIEGAAELGDLFELCDELDRNGSARSFVSARGGQETEAGAVYAALQDEIGRRRAAARMHGIIHVGMRPESSREVDALTTANPRSAGGVHAIRASGSQGKIELGGTTHDLTTPGGLAGFRDALVGVGVAPRRADAVIGIVERAQDAGKDEVAALALALHRVGTGELAATRLVLSGHSGTGAGAISDDPGTRLTFGAVQSLAGVFPEGAQRIKHLAFSACFTADPDHVDTFKRAFPALASVWTYDEFSPSATRGAPRHLATWEGLTDGDRPGAVDPLLPKVMTWNAADGHQWQKLEPLAKLERDAARLAPSLERYRSGAPLAEAQSDPHLRAYYAVLRQMQHHPDLDPARRAAIRDLADTVLRLRHPEM